MCRGEGGNTQRKRDDTVEAEKEYLEGGGGYVVWERERERERKRERDREI